MKAAVCYEYGKPLVVEDIDIDPPKKGEVKVRIAATALCHSDIHMIRGELGGKLPMVPGHESAGIVEELGEGVTTVKKGDHVVVSLLVSCGKCPSCVSGRPHQCEAQWPLNTESRLHNKKGQALAHCLRTASLAEYVIVDQSQTVPIPKDMPMDAAALLACGVITGYGAAVNRAQVRPSQSAVVIGTGGVGINSIQGAAICGAYPVIAVDVLDKKLELAKKFGATHGVNAKTVDPIKAVKDLTGGAGADYVFVTVGSVDAIKQGVSMCGRRGMTVVVGLPSMGQMLNLMPFEFIMPEKVLTGSFMGTTKLQLEIPKLVDLYKSGKLKLDELISGRYTLDQVNEAIDSVLKGEVIRNVVMFK
jgi:S-(hydroxymethyl)glutathione dehydrogenase / alcohol dehydrogenase